MFESLFGEKIEKEEDIPVVHPIEDELKDTSGPFVEEGLEATKTMEIPNGESNKEN